MIRLIGRHQPQEPTATPVGKLPMQHLVTSNTGSSDSGEQRPTVRQRDGATARPLPDRVESWADKDSASALKFVHWHGLGVSNARACARGLQP